MRNATVGFLAGIVLTLAVVFVAVAWWPEDAPDTAPDAPAAAGGSDTDAPGAPGGPAPGAADDPAAEPGDGDRVAGPDPDGDEVPDPALAFRGGRSGDTATPDAAGDAPAGDDLAGTDGPSELEMIPGTAVAYAVGGPPSSDPVGLAWSPGGAWLAWLGERSDGLRELRFTRGQIPPTGDTRGVEVPGGGGVAGAPVWHPSGVAVFPAMQGDATRLFFTSARGSGASEMLPRSTVDGSLRDPGIDPGGDRLAMSVDGDEGPDIAVWTRSTDDLSLVGSAPAPEGGPVFSPDGERLAWARYEEGGATIVVRDLGSGTDRDLAFVSEPTLPAWVDAGHLAWIATGQDGRLGVYVHDLQGEEVAVHPGVRRSVDGRPALWRHEDTTWLVAAPEGVADDRSVVLARALEPGWIGIATAQRDPAEPALTLRSGRVFLAYAGQGNVAGEGRRVFVTDITHAVR